MLKILIHLFGPLLTGIYVRRHGSIWKWKASLKEQRQSNAFQIALYNDWLQRLGSDIAHTIHFAGEPCFPHGPMGVFISQSATIGKNAVIFQHVTIGSNTLNDSGRTGSPTIGDRVYIGAGAKIIGRVRVGDNCRIGANAIVYEDVPANSVVVASPTRIIQKATLDNRYYSKNADGKWVFFDDGQWKEDDTKTI